jgi:hypothetical protein
MSLPYCKFRANRHWQIQYDNVTNNRELLDTNIDGDCLWLTLKEQDNRVVEKVNCNFSKEIRTDIDETVVDLESGIILIPYKQ